MKLIFRCTPYFSFKLSFFDNSIVLRSLVTLLKVSVVAIDVGRFIISISAAI